MLIHKVGRTLPNSPRALGIRKNEEARQQASKAAWFEASQRHDAQAS